MPAYMNDAAKAMPPPRARRRWLRVIIVLLALFGLGIAGLPYGIGYGLQWWLKQQGATEAQVADVDFNPFTGRLTIRGLHASAGDAGALKVREVRLRLPWRPLWGKHLYLEQVTLNDGQITGERLDDGSWRIAGLIFAGGAATTPAWGFGTGQLAISNLRLDYRGPGPRTALDIARVQLTHLASWDAKQDTHLAFQGRLNDGYADAYLEVCAREKRFPGLLDITHVPARFPYYEGPYLVGGKFTEFLSEKYGEEKLAEFHAAYGSYLLSYVSPLFPYVGLDRAARKVYGHPFERLWRQFEYAEITKEFAPADEGDD